ncbi:MAG: hypothetical protein CEE40_09895 [Chloroflexi bacterium B3_Chlor]|nr:MAG: hypothetical protein CEE40_09895 [Chloroflexi bacterium B3_Chlor]
MTCLELTIARMLIYFSSYVLAVAFGHAVVRHVILTRYPTTQAGGLKGAGAAIGCLERFLALTFVLVGQYEALAVIVAAKSIARFEELKCREFAEYYLIGTLSSILLAMLIGIFTSWLLSLL